MPRELEKAIAEWVERSSPAAPTRPIGIPVLSSVANKTRPALLMNLIAAPQRGVLASFAFLLISMLSAQALAFDVNGFKYDVIV